jgi:hypothetical protein
MAAGADDRIAAFDELVSAAIESPVVRSAQQASARQVPVADIA